MGYDVKVRINNTQYRFIKQLVDQNYGLSDSEIVRRFIDAMIILSNTDIFNILRPMTKEIAVINRGPYNHEIKVTLYDIHIRYIDQICSETGDSRSNVIRRIISLMYIWNNTGFYKFLQPIGEQINALEKASTDGKKYIQKMYNHDW